MDNNLLGYIELDTGPKLITPTNDIFLNWTFNKEEYWEELRMIANILYSAYIELYGDTKITLIEDEIAITTQFPFYKDVSSSEPNKLDMRIESIKKVDFFDFQNNMRPEIPISIRSTKYLGFLLSRGEDKQQASAWLLNGTIPELLHGKTFANYILMDEQDHHPHPIDANILYVDLKKLAKESSQAGELARVLTAVENDPKDEDVKKILHSLKQSFNEFKNCTEVKNIMTRAEALRSEGRVEGLAEGEAKGLAEKARKAAFKMLRKGYQNHEIADILEMPISWVDSLA